MPNPVTREDLEQILSDSFTTFRQNLVSDVDARLTRHEARLEARVYEQKDDIIAELTELIRAGQRAQAELPNNPTQERMLQVLVGLYDSVKADSTRLHTLDVTVHDGQMRLAELERRMLAVEVKLGLPAGQAPE